jgi:ATP-dependent Zn protease
MSLQPITPTEGLRPPDQGPPEVVRSKRPRLRFYDRVKWLVLLAALWFVFVWVATANDPILPFQDAMRLQVNDTWGIIIEVLFGLEIVRQIHFFVSEHWAWYNHIWVDKIFGGTERMSHRRMSPWVRFRLFRVVKWTFFIVAALFIIGQIMGVNPAIAAVQLPALIWQSLPMIIQIVLIIALGILQFAAIFWFMSRGGVDTYFPEDIKTRFADVWGQDQVLERVKESIVFLERPSEIEDKGGYVPGGILLWGPPGTGKTLMAEAVAGETGKPYVFVDPGAFNNMFFGVGILKVKALFRKLRKLALRYGGVIVFFDEADSLGSRGALATRGAFPRGFSAMSTSDGCHGMSYLSPEAQWYVLRYRHATPAPDGVRVWKTMPVMNGGMGGGGMGTLQSLLTEMSGLKKPRGFFNRHVRRALGMRPKPPPKYRIMVMMATNLPEALDEALLRPGRIDRIYKVGYPSKAGRLRTYEGYFNKVRHQLTLDDLDNLATMTPYATGATIKDLVNEALIIAIRDGRDTIAFKDVLRAKQLKELGPPEDVEYIQRDRHAVAVHEACHAVIAYRARKHYTIDIATIEKGGDTLGMVKAIKVEDQFVRWRTEYTADIYVSLASLAGERMFFEEDNSSGVSGDLESATLVATQMEGYWGMGSTVSSASAAGLLDTGTPGGGLPVPGANKDSAKVAHGRLADRVEENLARLLGEVKQMLAEHRREVLCLAHALETFKTLSGDDVAAVLNGEVGPVVDGRPYTSDALYQEIEAYHRAAVVAHMNHTSVSVPLPLLPLPQPAVAAVTSEWAWAGPHAQGNGSLPHPGLPNGSGAYPQVPAPPTPPVLPPAPPAPPGSIAPQSPAIPPGPAMPAPTETPYGTFPEGPQVWGPPPKDEPRSE